MANRTAECAFVIFASVVAGTPVTIVASSPARAADDCLTEPQGQAPQGQHWFYRTEHASKQRCWYLRDTGDKAAQADASADIAAPSQSNEAATSLSTTDAYAELPTPRPRAEQNGAASATRRAPAGTSIAANVKDSATPSATAPDDSVFGPPPTLSGSVETPGTSGAEDTSTTPEPEAAPVPAPPAAAAPPPKEVGSLQMLLLVIFGALTLAGLSGSLVYRLGRARQTAQAAKRRREIWRSADIARRRASSTDKQPKNLAAAKQPRNSAAARADFAHRRDSSRANTRAVDDRRATGMDAGGVDDKVERVEAFLSQLSKLAESDARSRPSRETRA